MQTNSNRLERAITDRSAWRVKTLEADSQWTYTFNSADIEDFDNAIEHLSSRSLKPSQYQRDDFPASVLDRLMPDFMHELEYGRGCLLLRGLPVERYDLETLKLIYWGFGAYVGKVISQNTKGDLLGYVTDLGNDYYANNVRGHTTSAKLRPHTDSCDVVALLCVRTAAEGGESLFASSMTIYNEILAKHPQFLEPLYRGFFIDLAGKGTTNDPNETTPHRIPVFSYFDGRLSCRFNSKQIREGAPKAEQILTALEEDAIDYVEELAQREDIGYRMNFQPGDIQLLNNHMILHARTAYRDFPQEDRKRLLFRQWWNLPNGRALAPDFANRLGTGARGGVTVRNDAQWPEGVVATDGTLDE